MKSWLCNNCGRRGDSTDDIIIKICNACQEEMEVEFTGKAGWYKKRGELYGES